MSSQKKGINTFRGYQEEKQRRREGLIDDYLRALKKMRMEFKYITQLAEMVAVHISQVEKADRQDRPCNASTLLRNKRYKSMLLSYMAVQMSGGIRREQIRGVSDPAREMALVESQLDAINLRNENQRLKAYIVQLEERVPQHGKQELAFEDQGALRRDKAMSDLQYKYVQTCKSLLLVLQRLSHYAIVDKEAMAIVDRSVRRGSERIIADAEVAGPFCEWMEANSFLTDPHGQ